MNGIELRASITGLTCKDQVSSILLDLGSQAGLVLISTWIGDCQENHI